MWEREVREGERVYTAKPGMDLLLCKGRMNGAGRTGTAREHRAVAGGVATSTRVNLIPRDLAEVAAAILNLT